MSQMEDHLRVTIAGIKDRLDEKAWNDDHVRVLRLAEAFLSYLEGSRGILTMSFDREDLGIRVREVWVAWAKTQPNPKPSWLLPWEELSEPDREVDRQIGETIAREVLAKVRDELLR